MKKVYIIIDKSKSGKDAVVRVYGSQVKAWNWKDVQTNGAELDIFVFFIEPRKEQGKTE